MKMMSAANVAKRVLIIDQTPPHYSLEKFKKGRYTTVNNSKEK